MIPAKEKAYQLVIKFEKLLFDRFTTDCDWVQCVNCALISVNEILKSNPTIITCNTSELNYAYWVKVKKELKKL